MRDEARYKFIACKHAGQFAALRKVIEVSAEEKLGLARLAGLGLIDKQHLADRLEFRAQVLAEFDRLCAARKESPCPVKPSN